jgi:hypothetical protein
MPYVNGNYYDSTCVKFALDDEPYEFTSIDYDDELAPGEVPAGSHPQDLGTTPGKYKASGKWGTYREEFMRFIKKNGNGYGLKKRVITVSYRKSEDDPWVNDVLHGVRVKKPANTIGNDSKALEVSVDLHVSVVLRDGVCIINNPRL